MISLGFLRYAVCKKNLIVEINDLIAGEKVLRAKIIDLVLKETNA